jgi:hypothetical protein
MLISNESLSRLQMLSVTTFTRLKADAEISMH